VLGIPSKEQIFFKSLKLSTYKSAAAANEVTEQTPKVAMPNSLEVRFLGAG
jgi:hypothetical protein